MMKKLILSSLLTFFTLSGALADDMPRYPLENVQKQDWSFSGPFGTYDKVQLQRGLKVYINVCSACHGLKYVHFRDLTALGYNDDEIKAFSARFTVADGPNDEGEMFDRPAQLNDVFHSPFANEKLAAFANGGIAPVDLSLVARARSASQSPFSFIFDVLTDYTTGGPDYIYAYLTGYKTAPEGQEIDDTNYYNPYFMWGDTTRMAPPLENGMVAYNEQNGNGQETPETVDQYARDVSAFLMWAADPHMEARKQLGMQVILFLIVFAVLVFLLKRNLWNDLSERDKGLEKT